MAHEPKYLVKTHDVEKVLRPRFNCSSTFPKGSFFNYFDQILPIIDHLPSTYYLRLQLVKGFFRNLQGNICIPLIFSDHLPTLSCQRS